MRSFSNDSYTDLRARRTWLLPLILIGLIAAGLYFATLRTSVTDCASDYCIDSGEFQIALATWGTVHHTGYPLYMFLGSPFVTALSWLGVSQAAGASLFSLVWEVLAVVGVALIIVRLTGKPWLACGAALLFAVMRPIWIHGSIPEVYSLSMAISVAILWLTLDLHESWSDGKGWLLAFVGGLGLAHHRLIGVLLVAVGLYLLPYAWRGKNFWRWLALSVPFFLLGFLPYIDMPLRVWRGATWVYGRPDTWNGFWSIFWGTEAADLQRPDFSLAALQAAGGEALNTLAYEFTPVGLALAGLGALAAFTVHRVRPPAVLFGLIFVLYVVFAMIMHLAVFLPADLMMAILALIVLLAIGLSLLPEKWQAPTAVVLLGCAAILAIQNYPYVLNLAQDPRGPQEIEQVETLEAPSGSVIMAPWGPRYFELAYAQRVEGRMRQWIIVDHRADLRQLASSAGGRVYTIADALYLFGPDWWTSYLHGPLRFTSAGPGMVVVSQQPLPAPTSRTIPIGDGLALAGWDIRPLDSVGETDVILYWTTTHTPSADYSTFIHVTNKDDIRTANDLLASSDNAAPVYSWYPTSHWKVNEVVREDHVIKLRVSQDVRTIFAGMYSRDSSGKFIQLGQVALRNVGGRWQAAP